MSFERQNQKLNHKTLETRYQLEKRRADTLKNEVAALKMTCSEHVDEIMELSEIVKDHEITTDRDRRNIQALTLRTIELENKNRKLSEYNLMLEATNEGTTELEIAADCRSTILQNKIDNLETRCETQEAEIARLQNKLDERVEYYSEKISELEQKLNLKAF